MPTRTFAAFAALTLAGCGSSFGPAPEPHQFFRSSTRTTCEDSTLVGFVNEPSVGVDTLVGVGVHSRGAQNLIEQRTGRDGIPGTEDDHRFSTVAEVDAVPWIGRVSIEAMYAANARVCDVVEDPEYACMERTVSEFASAADTTADDLKAIGVPTRGANEIVRVRNGADGVPATEDDVRFGSLDDIDAVPQVGEQTMADLLAWGLSQCQTSAEVVFSPQDYEDSHLAEVAARLDNARRSIDIAMYSMRDAGVQSAIERAAQRGVKIRMVLQKASEDRRDPEGTLSAGFEELGIEVRWINKIMHHKYAIIDGPRDHASQAGTGTLITGSGNWSNSAGTRFDENTLFLEGDARLNIAFQREFNLMWDWGRPVEWNETIVNEPAAVLTDADLADAEGAGAIFTSANFEPYQHSRYGPTFRQLKDRSVARDALVQLIHQADESIWIASGHLRSRPIFDALLTKRLHDPDIDIRVYLDGQEYVSQWYHQTELDEHADCLAQAESDADFKECVDDGYYFGVALANAGIDVRYKYYAYRWDYRYADQMHHKYVVVDKEIVATGSYNLSPNAEFDTFENLVMLHAGQYRGVVSGFVDNFEDMWVLERDTTRLADMLHLIENTEEDFPIVFEPMALTHAEVDRLKSAMYDNCPDINSDAYRENPGAHQWCER